MFGVPLMFRCWLKSAYLLFVVLFRYNVVLHMMDGCMAGNSKGISISASGQVGGLANKEFVSTD